ncbi:MAG: hypothetical protein JKY23_04395 [Nitrospinaceae bacterium]|nr:hypothetical protein [Nitrospinaceae bacterium]
MLVPVLASLVVVMSATSLILVSFVMNGDLVFSNPPLSIHNPTSTYKATVDNDDSGFDIKKGDTLLARFDHTSGLVLRELENLTTKTGQIRFHELDRNGEHFVSIRAPDALAADITYILPAADGSTGHVIKTDGVGLLSFTNITSTIIDSGAAGNRFSDNYFDAGTAGAVAVKSTGTLVMTSTGNTTINANAVILKGLTYPPGRRDRRASHRHQRRRDTELYHPLWRFHLHTCRHCVDRVRSGANYDV